MVNKDLKSFVLPVVLYGRDTDTEQRLEKVDWCLLKCMCTIMRYGWNDLASMSITPRYYLLTCIVCEHNSGNKDMWPPLSRPCSTVCLWKRESRGGQGGTPSSWLKQVDVSCFEVLRMWRGPIWRPAQRNPRLGIMGWARLCAFASWGLMGPTYAYHYL